MMQPIDYKKIKQIVETAVELKVEELLDEKLGENYQERFNRMENNIDKAVKIASDTQQELVVTQAKVDRHDREIKELQSFAGFSPA